MADLGTILERTSNLLANHRIPIESQTLAGLSLASKRLAQANEITSQDEHTAQLFFAQRGYDLSKHIHHVLTTQQVVPQPQVTPSIDFEIDRYVENQQEMVISNLLQQSIDYQQIATTDLFSTSLSHDWNATKQSILSSISYQVPLPTPQDPTNALSQQALASLPLQIPQPFNTLSTTQDSYAKVMMKFVNEMHHSHEQRDVIGLRENILSLPQQLIETSRQLEQQELSLPLSTAHGNISSQPSHPLNVLRQHEQSTELWMWFESLAQVLAISHLNEQQLDEQQAQQQRQQQQQQQQQQNGTIGGGDNATNNTASKLQYRYKNWFLHTKASHNVVATVDYLQQSFIEHMTNTIAQDHELSQEYKKQIEYILDDNTLMIELASIFCRTRDFRTRFLSQQHSLYQHQSDNQLVQLNQTGNNSLFQPNNISHHPNLELSPQNIWCSIFCCVRAGYYSAAIQLLEAKLQEGQQHDGYNNGGNSASLRCNALLQTLQLYVQQQETDPTVEVVLPPSLWVSLYLEMNSPTGTNNNNSPQQHQTFIQDANAHSNPFRKTIYSILGHFPLLPTEMKQFITPYVLTTIEDFIWYRLRLVTEQNLPQSLTDSYRATSTNTALSANRAGVANSANNTNLLDQLSLPNLQISILTRGKSYFTGAGSNNNGVGDNNINGSLLYIHVLFLTQQFERAIVELYAISPVLGFHLSLLCLVFGLIRSTDINSDVLTPINISLKTLQHLQSLQNSSTGAAMSTNGHFGQTIMQNTQHTRYAINMYKLITNYIQSIQTLNVTHAVNYAYYTRFIPLFGNIHLYNGYISNFEHNTKLISLEYNVHMTFNSSIPKNILQLYHTTILNINAPLSHLILTHDHINMTPLQYQQYYYQQQQQQQNQQQTQNQAHGNNDVQFANDFTFMAPNNNLNQSQLNLSTLNTTSLGGNLNLSLFNLDQYGNNTALTKTLIATLATTSGVELPIIIDLLLLNKADGSRLLGTAQHLYNFTPIVPPSTATRGVLYQFYPPDIIATMVQLTISRDKNQ